jgi:RimJ/RimL family protein N-acetyltransferase
MRTRSSTESDSILPAERLPLLWSRHTLIWKRRQYSHWTTSGGSVGTAGPGRRGYAEFMPDLDLRPVTAADAPSLQGLLGDLRVAQWLRPAGRTGPFTLPECERIVARHVAHWVATGFGTLLAWQDGRCIGWSVVQHTVLAGRSEVEIGWSVAPDLWGQGVATELGQRALASARSVGLERVVAYTRTDNLASQRVMEKLGLQYERDFEHAGLRHVLYSIEFDS